MGENPPTPFGVGGLNKGPPNALRGWRAKQGTPQRPSGLEG